MNIACSRQVPPRRLNQAPAIVSAFSETLSPLLYAQIAHEQERHKPARSDPRIAAGEYFSAAITRRGPFKMTQKSMMNTQRPKSATPFANRAKRWTSNGPRTESKGSPNSQRSYERYLALAQAQAQSGDVVGAENYYQHAEHYFRSMSSDRDAT